MKPTTEKRSQMRRVLAVLVGAGIALGGGAAAWAQTATPDGSKREAARACLSQAREAAPDADRAALREAVKACLTEAGIEGRVLPRHIRAKLAGARECLSEVRAANPEASRSELRALVKECVAAK
jgi:hypothetical protein